MLTDIQVRSLKPRERPYKVSDGRGLILFVSTTGARSWRFQYRFEGKQRTAYLGKYPDISLARARERLQGARTMLAEGVDPAAGKANAEKTFEDVAREWFERWKEGRHERHAHYVIRRLEQDVFPQLGSGPISEIPASAFRDAVRKVEARGAMDIAKRILQVCGQIMRYAVANDLATQNPIAGIRPRDILKPSKKRHYVRVDAAELPQLLKAIDGYVGSDHTRSALQLMALTFVRTNELTGALWSEFDFPAARWNIPASRMKMRTPHIVPLSTQAIAVLKQLKQISHGREFVFPGDLKPDRPMSNNTLLFALYRMGYRGRMTGHGFRGVASTILHEQGWPHEHIEIQLAHQERDAVSAAYNHALYLQPRTLMMQSWADHLSALRERAQGDRYEVNRSESDLG